jgi:hypothetical protein
LKYVLAFFAFVIFSVPIVNAQELVEEDGQPLEDKSWYEIDGIKIRYGLLRNHTSIYLSSETNTSSGSGFIRTNQEFSHLDGTPISPIAIVLPETLMNSWSFRGAVFEFQSETGVKDLSPSPDDNSRNNSLETKVYNENVTI